MYIGRVQVYIACTIVTLDAWTHRGAPSYNKYNNRDAGISIWPAAARCKWSGYMYSLSLVYRGQSFLAPV